MILLKTVLPDGLLVVGAASVAYGAWMAWQPAGFIVGGALLLIAGLNLAKVS